MEEEEWRRDEEVVGGKR